MHVGLDSRKPGPQNDFDRWIGLPQTKERADTSRGQKRQNPCPSSLRASDMFARVQQLISVHDNKLRSGTLPAFSGLY